MGKSRCVNTKPKLDAFYEQTELNRKFLEQFEMTEEVRKVLAAHDLLLAKAEAAADAGDVDTLLAMLDNTTELAFVVDNIAWLKALGKYERALLSAYVDTKTNFSRWQVSVLKHLFAMADRPALLDAGDPLPGPGPFTVFRGVAGHGARRRLRSISWTADMEKAVWFAKRSAMMGSLPLPAVYETTVPVERVFAFYNGREEREFLCDIDAGSKLRRVWVERS